jgi:hypothetical protein
VGRSPQLFAVARSAPSEFFAGERRRKTTEAQKLILDVTEYQNTEY